MEDKDTTQAFKKASTSIKKALEDNGLEIKAGKHYMCLVTKKNSLTRVDLYGDGRINRDQIKTRKQLLKEEWDGLEGYLSKLEDQDPDLIEDPDFDLTIEKARRRAARAKTEYENC